MSQDLRRFRRRSAAPETRKRLLLASILEMNDGPLGETAIREVLAGKNRRQAAANTAIIGG
jgi:hypothetical protein